MRSMTRLLFALLLLGSGTAFADTAVPVSQAEIKLSFAPVVKQSAPAVVNVYAKLMVQQPEPNAGMFNDPLFREFFGNRMGQQKQRAQASLGSGVIVDPRGLIVTNNHVVKGGTDIRVVLADKREFVAKVLLTDDRTDLAVLKIEAPDEKLPALGLADSDNLAVGDLVLAIGNPFGVGQTVTSGIVSALARTDVGVSDYQFYIQTDAAINPGNSGGALVNMAGQVVGINSAIYSRSGGSIGIGFAIPSNMVKTVVESAELGKRIQRPWIGATLQDVTQDIADSLGFARPEGALIVGLDPQSPLAKAGLQRGDVVLAIEGKPVENAKELNYRVATSAVGAAAIIEFQSKGERKEAQVTLIAAPETIDRAETLIEGRNPLAGMVAANLSPAVADELGLPSNLKGVVALKVGKGPAMRFLRPGDIVLGVNGTEIKSVEALKQAMAEDSNYWQIAILREGRVLNLSVGG
jgi:Do/DeqQ family serine protease